MNWAIESGNQTYYIAGSQCATAEDAEKEWRKLTHLYFVTCTVRRTTPEEDRRLQTPTK